MIHGFDDSDKSKVEVLEGHDFDIITFSDRQSIPTEDTYTFTIHIASSSYKKILGIVGYRVVEGHIGSCQVKEIYLDHNDIKVTLYNSYQVQDVVTVMVDVLVVE